MVSFLSFFRRKAPQPQPGTSRTDTATSPERPKPATRFLSLRSKPSTRPKVTTDRRASTDLTRRRSYNPSRIPSNSSGQPFSTSESPPKLALPFDVESFASDEEFGGNGEQGRTRGSPLMLDDVGRRPRLGVEEVKALEGIRDLNCDEVKSGWEWFGKGLRDMDQGTDTLGLMLPRRLQADKAQQQYLLALYIAIIRPDSLHLFPSISVALPSSEPASQIQGNARSRLQSAIDDTSHHADLAEVLKWILRRLDPISTSSATPLTAFADQSSPQTPGFTLVSSGIISSKIYTTFVQAEHSASYPATAYKDILLPTLPYGVSGYLHELFEVWAAIVTHADVYSMGGGRICHLLGWWVLGLGSFPRREDKTEGEEAWNCFYEEWKTAGRRIEHIFYAWIRTQATTQQLPTRLLELVKDYPFGESSASSDHLPLPPPSSFPQNALHVSLAVDAAKFGKLSPDDLLNALQSANPSEGASFPHWTALIKNDEEKPTPVLDLLSDQARSFLEEISKPPVIVSPKRSPSNPESFQLLHDETVYRPFAASQTKGDDSRRRSQSYGDIPIETSNPSPTQPTLSPVGEDVVIMPGSYSDERSPVGITNQISMGMLRSSTEQTMSGWEDFEKIGFGDSVPDVKPLSIKSSTSRSGTPPQVNIGPSYRQRDPAKNKAKIVESPKKTYSIISERILAIDNVFTSFVEDGQLDPSTTISWPSFVLLRLKDSLTSSSTDTANPIEYLLITIEAKPAPPKPTQPTEVLARSASPGSESITSKVGSRQSFRDIAGNFRRSSSYGGKSKTNGGMRKSIFGGSGRNLSKVALEPLSEGAGLGLGAAIAGNETKRTGATFKDDSPKAAPVSQETSGTPSSDRPAPLILATNDTASATPLGTGITPSSISLDGPATDSRPADWTYMAEGGFHVVFTYKGDNSYYLGKVLRIRKLKKEVTSDSPITPTFGDDPAQVQRVWRDQLLPRLFGEDNKFLVGVHEVILPGDWVNELVETAESVRPVTRKIASGNLVGGIDLDAGGVIMDDLTDVLERAAGETVLAIEIKSKWGFLPSPTRIRPAEAVPIKSQNCRFCMHTHYRKNEVRYCPLHLFDPETTFKALEDLKQGWIMSEGKENNWKVFVNGQMTFPDDDGELPHAAPGLIASTLLESGVLPFLKGLQSTLDPTDISDLVYRLQELSPSGNMYASPLLAEPNIEELSYFIDRYNQDPLAGSEESWSLRERLIAYALSAIFKDCSIFVKVTVKRSGTAEWTVDHTKSVVKLVDVDLKPMKAFRKWVETDDKVWKYWYETKVPHSSGDKEILTENVNASSASLPDTIGQSLAPNSVYGMESSSTRALFNPTPDNDITLPITSQPDNVEIISDDETRTAEVVAPDLSVEDEPTKPVDQVVASSISMPDAKEEEVEEGDLPDRAIVHESDHFIPPPPTDRSSIATDIDRSDSPVAQRLERSMAPSPSPIPHEGDIIHRSPTPVHDHDSKAFSANDAPVDTTSPVDKSLLKRPAHAGLAASDLALRPSLDRPDNTTNETIRPIGLVTELDDDGLDGYESHSLERVDESELEEHASAVREHGRHLSVIEEGEHVQDPEEEGEKRPQAQAEKSGVPIDMSREHGGDPGLVTGGSEPQSTTENSVVDPITESQPFLGHVESEEDVLDPSSTNLEPPVDIDDVISDIEDPSPITVMPVHHLETEEDVIEPTSSHLQTPVDIEDVISDAEEMTPIIPAKELDILDVTDINNPSIPAKELDVPDATDVGNPPSHLTTANLNVLEEVTSLTHDHDHSLVQVTDQDGAIISPIDHASSDSTFGDTAAPDLSSSTISEASTAKDSGEATPTSVQTAHIATDQSPNLESDNTVNPTLVKEDESIDIRPLELRGENDMPSINPVSSAAQSIESVHLGPVLPSTSQPHIGAAPPDLTPILDDPSSHPLPPSPPNDNA